MKLKLRWKKTTDSVKIGRGLKGKKEEVWYKHLNSAMTETYP